MGLEQHEREKYQKIWRYNNYRIKDEILKVGVLWDSKDFG